MTTNGPISADYPGGNIIVQKLESGRAWLSPDFRNMQEGFQWFYWSFRARNPEPLIIVFSHPNYIASHGPATSRDGGNSWEWLGREKVTVNQIGEQQVEFSFEIPPVAAGEDVRYSFCPQYQESNFRSWLHRHQDHPFLKVSELCRSRNGRSVEQIHIGAPSGERKMLWLTARHHSCEAMASYVMEGFLDAALEDDEVGRQLRANWEIVAMPFMDKDGVEEGDQGKLRHPHDHNRDYNEQPIYPEVAAAMRFGEKYKRAITAFLDLHCPMVHGPWDNRFYMVGNPASKVSARQGAFMKAFAAARSEGSEHSGAELHLLHFGKAWNTNSNFSAGKSAAIWAGEAFADAEIISTFEIPYANADGVEVNPGRARVLGRDLAAALLHYLGGAVDRKSL